VGQAHAAAVAGRIADHPQRRLLLGEQLRIGQYRERDFGFVLDDFVFKNGHLVLSTVELDQSYAAAGGQ
jgi:hypothetical protein